jgi:hypothetical protein
MSNVLDCQCTVVGQMLKGRTFGNEFMHGAFFFHLYQAFNRP